MPLTTSPPHTNIQDARPAIRQEQRRLRAPEAQDRTQFPSSDETIEIYGGVGICDVRSRHQSPVPKPAVLLTETFTRSCTRMHSCLHTWISGRRYCCLPFSCRQHCSLRSRRVVLGWSMQRHRWRIRIRYPPPTRALLPAGL